MRLTDENVTFKSKLQRGEVCLGAWVTFSDPCTAECMVRASSRAAEAAAALTKPACAG